MKTNITYELLELLGFKEITNPNHKEFEKRFRYNLSLRFYLDVHFTINSSDQVLRKIEVEVIGTHTQLSKEFGPTHSVENIIDVIRHIADFSQKAGIYEAKLDFGKWLQTTKLIEL